jgi:hypothetical protein
MKHDFNTILLKETVPRDFRTRPIFFYHDQTLPEEIITKHKT